MLVKIISNDKEYLIILHLQSYEEFLMKTKQILRLESSCKISVEFSGCNVDENIFKEVLQDFGEKKELIRFVIGITTSIENEFASSQEYTQVEYLNEPDLNQILQHEARNDNIGNTSDRVTSYQTEGPVSGSSAVVTEHQIIDRRLVVNPEIPLIKFEEIFEVGKLLGLIRSGLPLEPSHRFYVAKAFVKTVLTKLGFDYM